MTRIRQNVARTGPGKFFGHRLVTLAGENETPHLRELRIRLLRQVYPDDTVDHVRAQIEASSFQGERDVYLNRLALWVPDAVRDRWFAEAPVTFAQAIAVVRSAQATRDSHRPGQHRTRVRA